MYLKIANEEEQCVVGVYIQTMIVIRRVKIKKLQ